MKAKVIPLLSWLALTILVQVISCNATNAESPLSAIDWLSELYKNIDKIQSPSVLINKEPNEFSIISPKVNAKKITKLNMDRIYEGDVHLARYKELLEMISNELPPPLITFFHQILSAKSERFGKSKHYNDLILIRLNKLLELGATVRAQNLLETLDLSKKESYDIWFDIHLLSLSEETACDKILKKNTSISKYKDRIFCLIQSGDTKIATLTLSGAATLGLLSLEEEIILYNLLYFKGKPIRKGKKIVQSVSPINYRVSKIIGANIEHLDLPSAYHYSELRSNISENKKLLYTENLVRNGVLPYESLRALYSAANLNTDDRSSKRASLSKALEISLAGVPTIKSLRKFITFLDSLADVGLEKFALRHYSMDLLKIVNKFPNSRKALGLLLRSADLKVLKNISNTKKLNSIYQNIIFNTPVDYKTINSSEKIIIDALQNKNIPREFDLIMTNRSTGEAVLTAIHMLQGKKASEITDVEKGIKFLSALGFNDLAREVLIYKLVTNEVDLE